MAVQEETLQRVFFCFCVLLMIPSKFVESVNSAGQDSDSKIEAAQDTESRTVPLSTSSIHRTNEILKPSQIRNRRSNLLTEKEQLYDDNAGLDSAFLYSDQIMQNLLKTQSPKPLSYARSNFFLNLLKPRTTRYNAWDDHSLMHFGKRSVKDRNNGDKVLVKRSADLWSPNNVMHFGKKSTILIKDEETSPDVLDFEIPNFEPNLQSNADSLIDDSNNEDQSKDSEKEEISKKSADPWHSMMSFGKKSESPLDYNTLHFDKKDEPWHNKMSFGKKSDNSWDHNTMHFGKRDDPWHNMMSFGKKSDPWHSMMSFGKKSENPWDHNTLHFGKRDDPWHNKMSFGKRFENSWDHSTLHFGKRDPWDHNTLHFGKKDEPWHNMMSFGKRSDPWHSMMSFGKRYENPLDHNTLHFGKKDKTWNNMISPEKSSEISDMTDLEKREDPWHNMMSFGKKSDGIWNSSTTPIDKRDEPWHSMMSFGKRADYGFDHNTMHFGKREDPWHSMMSFGKRADNGFDHSTMHFGKREEPWHSMMSFGKRADNGFDHNTMHFGKREEPWHSMMSFGKRAEYGFDHNTMHFGKREEPWHSMMSFGKKSDPWEEHNTFHFGKRDDPWHNKMSFGKRPYGMNDDLLLEDFAQSTNPWEEYNGMVFNKKSNPWDHNALHFGKKTNISLDSILSEKKEESHKKNRIQKRSTDMWNDHHTMHFGKKSDPWENHNTLHFGKKSDPWESHNTMHFGKKSDPWESHNTMHFGKKSELQDLENPVNADKKFDWDSHNTMHFGKKSSPWDYHNTMHFGKRDPFDYHNTMHFGKRDPWDYHNTMHFGKRDPWDHHNTMHFGKRDPFDYHNTMHFGKRDPWDYHNTMHFGKRSDSALTGESTFSDSKNNDEKEGNGIKNKNRDKLGIQSAEKDESNRSNLHSSNVSSDKEDKKTIKETSEASDDNQKSTFQSRVIKRSLKSTESLTAKNKMIKDNENKFDYGFTSSVNEEQIMKPSVTNNILDKQVNKRNDTHAPNNNTNSRISKRSVKPGNFRKNDDEDSENQDLNTGPIDDYSKDDFPDTVLHFGKRSVDLSEDSEIQWPSEPEVKRFDDYWDSHNTLHFGKKSDPWDSHSTLHFGKKSNPWEDHSTMHFGKRDPWDYHNTLHFGKKFDPWEGHAKMHFGKRTDDWGHNVMHFGKREELSPDEIQSIRDIENLLELLVDPASLKDLIQESNEKGGMNDEENKEFLENLENLEVVVNSHLKDENMPIEDKLNILKSYLKPILKALLSEQVVEEADMNAFADTEGYSDRDVNTNDIVEGTNGMPEMSNEIPLRTIANDINYDEGIFSKDREDISDGQYLENPKMTEYLKEYKNQLKSKRTYFRKPELKRYFVPFQGPKSIVYPHAWFASQIRRSYLPRTTNYDRGMEMRMAEKKEDPFNSYMHFGRR